MAQGIILAAGFSSRAQANKLLFEIQGVSLIEHAIQGMKPFVSQIIVVTGHYSKDIEQRLSNDPTVRCMYHADYAKGMFSSIKAGVFVVDEDFFILPGDCPFVQKDTYRMLLQGTGLIRVPSFHQRRGHPIWFDHTLKEKILEEPIDSSLKQFRNRYDFETIDVMDQHILDDIDTLLDFQKILRED
jgi:molybdenum cofactor cytidylyltransferase